MIAYDVLRDVTAFREAYLSAQPFRHVCIDRFFEPEAAEGLLRDFPRFDPANAINELGEPGGKSVNTKLTKISPFYSRVHTYLMSPEFLGQMTAITGIPDLIADPNMFGGGTHDNQHGQALDPHVDFNLLTIDGTAMHRRVN